MTDENGNPVAKVFGGPDDGKTFFCHDTEHGDTFVPLKVSNNRPVYRFDKLHPAGARFVFVGWSDEEREV